MVEKRAFSSTRIRRRDIAWRDTSLLKLPACSYIDRAHLKIKYTNHEHVINV